MELYQFYNCDHPGWPYNLPRPPYPSHLKAFVYAALNVESEEMATKSRMQRQSNEATRHPKSKFSR